MNLGVSSLTIKFITQNIFSNSFKYFKQSYFFKNNNFLYCINPILLNDFKNFFIYDSNFFKILNSSIKLSSNYINLIINNTLNINLINISIINCIFQNINCGNTYGSIKIDSLNSNCSIKYCLFKNNFGTNGCSGLSIYNSNSLIKNCCFLNNSSNYQGATFYGGTCLGLVLTKKNLIEFISIYNSNYNSNYPHTVFNLYESKSLNNFINISNNNGGKESSHASTYGFSYSYGSIMKFNIINGNYNVPIIGSYYDRENHYFNTSIFYNNTHHTNYYFYFYGSNNNYYFYDCTLILISYFNNQFSNSLFYNCEFNLNTISLTGSNNIFEISKLFFFNNYNLNNCLISNFEIFSKKNPSKLYILNKLIYFKILTLI